MNKNWHGALWYGVLLLIISTTTQATLLDRGNGLIYDDQLDITWLWDANYAATQWADSGGTLGDADGRMTWYQATAWAAGLEYMGYDDWRLPTTTQPDPNCSYQASYTGYPLQGYGYNCTGSEMGYMFYTNLGGTAGYSILSATDPNGYLDLFENIQSYVYWSGTEFAPNTNNAWNFNTNNGNQNINNKDNNNLYAWAVRSGE